MKKTMSIEQINERDKILFGTAFNMQNYPGGLRYFDIPIETVEMLIEKGYLSPDRRKNNSPAVSEFIKFCKDHADIKWYFHGFAVSPIRGDTEIVIEGIHSAVMTCLPRCNGKTLYSEHLSECKEDFDKAFTNADELVTNGQYLWCWYD